MRKFGALLLLLLAPTASVPQRYGRPYTLAENPQLLLEVKIQGKSNYLRLSALRKMQRVAVTLNDPATNAPHVYEGVSLGQLVPGAVLSAAGGSMQIEYGAQHTLRNVNVGDVDPQMKPMVVDKIDGKDVSGYTPFWLLVKPRGKSVETITDVQCLTVK